MPLYKIGPTAVAFAVVLNAFEASGMKYTKSNELFNILWAKRATPYTLESLTPYQKVNHFPGAWGLGRKDNLAVNINMMKRYHGEEVYGITPPSFWIPRQQADLEKDAARDRGDAENPPIYIVKPCASSCGRGITLHKGVPPMPVFLKEFVCQRYIGDPLLISGRKFDLRLYCVVTSFDPLRIYLFDEGLVRFAAMKYPGSDKELDNINMHLTNYSINKTAELKRQTGEKGLESEDPIEIKWCISDLKKYLMNNHPDGIKAWETIQRGCDDTVVKAFLSVENSVIERIRQSCLDKTGRNCFELFGIDLLVDSRLKVWLIEMNIMPSLATGSNLDKAVKSRMLAHMLTLIRVIPNRRNALDDQPNENGSDHEPGEDYVPRGAAPTTPERIYKFGHHPAASSYIKRVPLLKRFNDPNVEESMLSRAEVLMLIEAEEEMHCAGGFRRVFPASDTLDLYLPLFTHGVRRNNFLLASAVKQKVKNSECILNLGI
ncbi:unnamed protein product [Phytomonas sp. EM1]|nr:unnamed protein product [Phytomonas sp. EM1]|eukprot:CCW64393.1 unnamed protein product [Phytomonas sp. isolate EM1]